MPRANRYYQEGFVYHITHRCHQRKFLLARKKDKRSYRNWLYKAVKRYKLCVLNYIITDNHIHLLVLDTGDDVIPNAMRFVASRTAYAYNRRKRLEAGGFWEGRYFSTAVQKKDYLLKCMVYIALNMVRAGIVAHPKDWVYGGYYELINQRKRYCVLQEKKLIDLLGYQDRGRFIEHYNKLITETLLTKNLKREPQWSEQSCVGDELFKTGFSDLSSCFSI